MFHASCDCFIWCTLNIQTCPEEASRLMVFRSIQPRLASSLWFTSRNCTMALLAASVGGAHTHTNRITDAFNSLCMWIKSIFTRQLVCDWPHLGKDAKSIRGDDMQAVSFLIHPLLPHFERAKLWHPSEFTKDKTYSEEHYFLLQQKCNYIILKSTVITNTIHFTYIINTLIIIYVMIFIASVLWLQFEKSKC